MQLLPARQNFTSNFPFVIDFVPVAPVAATAGSSKVNVPEARRNPSAPGSEVCSSLPGTHAPGDALDQKLRPTTTGTKFVRSGFVETV